MSRWLPWGAQALEKARSESKPVLVCFEEVPEAEAERLAAGYVPVRSTSHERPDLRLRYGPAAVLSWEGKLLERLPSVDAVARLMKEAGRYGERAGEPLPRAAGGPVWTGAVGVPVPEAPDRDWPRRSAASLLDGPRRPYRGAELELLLHAAAEWRDERAHSSLIDALSSAPEPSGAWARAARATLLWDAFAVFGSSLLLEKARSLTASLPAAGERDAAYADVAARTALSLMRASAHDGDAFRRKAEAHLDFIQDKLYDPLLGVLHCQGAGARPMVYGLLGDNAWSVLAGTEAFLRYGVAARRDFADVVLKFLFQELWERERGGFLDKMIRPDDVGELRQARLDPETNAVALEATWRLHHLKGNANYGKWAEWGLRGALSEGAAASLARVADILARGRMEFELVGRGEPSAVALVDALNRRYLPRRILSFVDPDDQDYILAHKLQAPSFPRLFACVGLRPVAQAGAAEEVAGLIRALEAS